MLTVTAKIRMAAGAVVLATAFVASIAGAAAAQETNPFLDEKFPARTAPSVKRTDTDLGKPSGTGTGAADRQTPGYLVGTWRGHLANGQGFRIRFARNGRVAVARDGSNVALVGRYSVTQGRIRFRIVAHCSMSTNHCQQLRQPKFTTIAFRRIDRRTLQVREGYIRRVG